MSSTRRHRRITSGTDFACERCRGVADGGADGGADGRRQRYGRRDYHRDGCRASVRLFRRASGRRSRRRLFRQPVLSGPPLTEPDQRTPEYSHDGGGGGSRRMISLRRRRRRRRWWRRWRSVGEEQTYIILLYIRATHTRARTRTGGRPCWIRFHRDP